MAKALGRLLTASWTLRNGSILTSGVAISIEILHRLLASVVTIYSFFKCNVGTLGQRTALLHRKKENHSTLQNQTCKKQGNRAYYKSSSATMESKSSISSSDISKSSLPAAKSSRSAGVTKTFCVPQNRPESLATSSYLLRGTSRKSNGGLCSSGGGILDARSSSKGATCKGKRNTGSSRIANTSTSILSPTSGSFPCCSTFFHISIPLIGTSPSASAPMSTRRPWFISCATTVPVKTSPICRFDSGFLSPPSCLNSSIFSSTGKPWTFFRIRFSVLHP
mmetsp:Transcript_9302/g.18491  ORF Transcript_9302/g.18491 Transcript_9302/m.18491 type:complete len:279 (+) Transcript_9302:769-1605(+)